MATVCEMMNLPDYQRLACELAKAAWEIEAEAKMGGDVTRVAKASEIASRAIAMCNDLGVAPPCPPNHPWCASGCEKRGVAGRCVPIAPDRGTRMAAAAPHG